MLKFAPPFGVPAFGIVILTLAAACNDSSRPRTDGGAQACEAPQRLRYEEPGCGASASPVCGRSEQDGCRSAVCSCSGVVNIGCDYVTEPFAYRLDDPAVAMGTSCDPTRADAQPFATQPVEERGVLRLGNEAMSFRRCGQTQEWWWDTASYERGMLVGAAMLDGAWGRDPACPDGGACQARRLYARVRGLLSSPGQYGHLSQYRRQIDITHIYETSPTVPEDCDP